MNTPQLIGSRFELQREIGQGGMGAVYFGIDQETGKEVAVKSLRSDVIAQDPSIIERFAREAEALRRLNHPNIVTGITSVQEGDQYYLVMEYVPGGTLEDLLKAQSRLPASLMMQLSLDLCDALARAHRLGIVHRDVKPGNVLIASDGSPRLTDFGLARIADTTQMTQAGSIIGTYGYLSPEACMGEKVDERSDIWSLGVMFYEMLAGVRPFDRPSAAATLMAIIQQPERPLRELRPDIPAPLANLIERMLTKDRSERVQSARQVGSELEIILQGGIPTPALTSREQRAARRAAAPPPDAPVADDDESDDATLIFEEQRVGRAEAPQDFDPDSRETIDEDATIVRRPFRESDAPPTRPKPPRSPRLALPAFGLLLLAALIVGGALLLRPSVPTSAPAQLVQPVQAGEYMVLVAQLEQLGDAPRPQYLSAILNDLEFNLIDSLPLSRLRLRAYPDVITSAEQAAEAARANAAPLIIWGGYDDDRIELYIQVGSLAAFDSVIPRERIEQTANVRVQMINPERESIAPQVLGALGILHLADSNGYEYVRVLAVPRITRVTPAVIDGNSIASHYQRAFAIYNSNPNQALESLDQALALDSSNPFLYILRSLIHFNLNQREEAVRDAETALTFNLEGWAPPRYLIAFDAFILSDDLDTSLPLWDELTRLHDNHWFPIMARGLIHYRQGDYVNALVDLEASVALGSDTNYPYPFLAMIYLKNGRLVEAQRLLNSVLERLPDPVFGEELLLVTFGEGYISDNKYALTLAAFDRLLLRDWNGVVETASRAVEADPEFLDPQVMLGLGQCNLEQDTEAEAAYTSAIELDPDFPLLYLLRAEVRRNQGNLLGAAADISVVQESSQAAIFAPVIAASLSGEISCANLFDVDLAALGD